jgi:hypothetical protein
VIGASNVKSVFAPVVAKAAPISTHVEDSDDEASPAVKTEQVKEPEPDSELEPEQKVDMRSASSYYASKKPGQYTGD